MSEETPLKCAYPGCEELHPNATAEDAAAADAAWLCGKHSGWSNVGDVGGPTKVRDANFEQMQARPMEITDQFWRSAFLVYATRYEPRDAACKADHSVSLWRDGRFPAGGTDEAGT